VQWENTPADLTWPQFISVNAVVYPQYIHYYMYIRSLASVSKSNYLCSFVYKAACPSYMWFHLTIAKAIHLMYTTSSYQLCYTEVYLSFMKSYEFFSISCFIVASIKGGHCCLFSMVILTKWK
jgi:hypothetical protein